ncbi:hypothetical protein PR202_ga01814 [Eleusine coracana subsp. coracana]|uniref:GPI ethanolamine phosphate transferase 1 n=1 Tax=Eleusine coracana subsp. coracana TaxID=191504 RepID=A0AAV5BI21_ELECO|nr:hypothetical protein PR202_ga01127 [Eleusine coracana subsp. coracana]GJM85997.1 hypothetical protein PR202_ga01814 [Eleusine coracana subsp. coracana]
MPTSQRVSREIQIRAPPTPRRVRVVLSVRQSNDAFAPALRLQNPDPPPPPRLGRPLPTMAGRPRPQPQQLSPSASTRGRERWLVVLGVALHAVYMLSIFDIYFKSPIVHGMAPVPPRLSAPPAKRLVLLVADGLRADKFYEPDGRGRYRAPFLRGVIQEKGRWGVSHARPPTESRPGHVSIIAGFYEDPSAVTKGWKANPVEFDSVFNQSRHTISFGSPDIVPIFCSSLPHSTWGTYPHEYEDFATAESVYNLMESYFKDNQTAYVFTADHGMSDKGSHGDGHPSNTDTPLVVWGAGVRSPKFLTYTEKPDDGFRFVDDHKHDTPTPQDWALEGFERVDVNQADIAPLMSTLVGLPCPMNSVGSLPTHYLKLSKADEVEAVLANSKQILNQFLRKSVLNQIEDLISAKDYETALKHSEELRRMALAGLHYFQTYDWFMLMTTITLGYVGWMVNLILHVLQSYTSLPVNLQKKAQLHPKNTSMKV